MTAVPATTVIDWTAFATEHELADAIFAELGRQTGDGVGITRECYSDREDAALEVFCSIARAYGFAIDTDAAGNMVVRMAGDDGEKAAHYIGSHADSVPQGGNYDGAAGIVAGLMCLVRLARSGRELATPVRVLMLRGEESAFYGRANIGSRALFGILDDKDLAARSRGKGRTLAEAMAATGIAVDPIRNGEILFDTQKAASYLELHIEQGPVMTDRALPAAVVSGIRGNVRHRKVVCRGEAGHSGTIPRWWRKDAVFAFADLVGRLDEHWRVLLERGLDLVVTTGIVGTDPEEHAISRIPGEVMFSFEVRSQSHDTLEGFYELFRSECRSVGQLRGVHFDFDDRVYTEPAKMDAGIIAMLTRAAEDCGLDPQTLPSGAGHDAAVFANAGVPSGMVFVRNANGSHNPHEAMDVDDLIKGTDVLYKAVTSTN
ncbi:hydantoinase/carbamoylase family amidase [Pelagibacterium luteolum]|uniref:N-carbamoyl-L-amino-acid hydrolase n=1 Tax=Pelagibacterium luteolum TaxID=440168 RepID=A0A1G7RZF4_9HYPH|nr:hydantoinase/carbamoylase family amidase [Pelagibacterium luteolum]SDG16138.1 N-carbamoyl-L-amino-acid hydrolase [Pelagibacterium luteolum]